MIQGQFAAQNSHMHPVHHQPAMQHQPAGMGLCGMQNVGFAERMISATVGGGLVTHGLKHLSLRGLALAMIGGALVHRGVTGVCQLYQSMGMNTAVPPNPHPGVRARHGEKVEKAIVINRRPEELYRFWRNFENLPQIMNHLVSVEVLSDRRSHWTAKGPLGVTLQWDAEIHTERENELIGWQSVGEGDVSTAGSVHFEPASLDATVLTVSMKYDPPGGKAGIAAAQFLGQDLNSILEEDLQQFKALMEGSSAPAFEPMGGVAPGVPTV